MIFIIIRITKGLIWFIHIYNSLYTNTQVKETPENITNKSFFKYNKDKRFFNNYKSIKGKHNSPRAKLYKKGGFIGRAGF